MPQPLPVPIVPSAAGLIDAQRLGHSDFLENQKRELMQRAGGLAAAGDMSGARNELYKGGEFGEARGISAEQRAAASHAQSMSSAKLEKALQAQGLLGRLAGSIQTQEQLDTAKGRLKGIGLDVGNVTLDQLPQLRDQALSVQEQLTNETTKRRLDILQQKANAAAGAQPKMTEGQRKAASYVSVMKNAQEHVAKVLPDESSKTPMGTVSSFLSNSPYVSESISSKYRDKKQNQYQQAAEQWVIAKLRHQSGATILPDEIRKEMRNFWPVVGDDTQTRKNKASARKAVEDAISLEATGPVAAPAGAGGNAALPDDFGQWTDEQIVNGQ